MLPVIRLSYSFSPPQQLHSEEHHTEENISEREFFYYFLKTFLYASPPKRKQSSHPGTTFLNFIISFPSNYIADLSIFFVEN